MKKVISVIAAVLLLTSLLSISAFAHGGGHHRSSRSYRQPAYETCVTGGCDILGHHRHSGVWYSQNEYAGNYDVCSVEDCDIYGIHEHDGTYYYCASHGSGYGCGRWAHH